MKNIMYLVDNYVFFYYKGNCIKSKIDNVLKNGKIANIKKFNEQFKRILNDNHINISIFGATIKVIVNPSYTNADVEVLKNVLENLGFNKISVINEIRLYKLNKHNAYLNYNNEYALLTFINIYEKKEFYIIEKSIFNAKELKKFTKSKIHDKDLLVFGLNNTIDEFVENYGNNCYHFYNDETYLIDLMNK